MTHPARITVLTSHKAPLCKAFDLHGGKIRKQSSATLHDGRAETVQAGTAGQLLGIIEGLGHKQALSAGCLTNDRLEAPITTQSRARPGFATRTKEDLFFPGNAGWLFWDYDDKTMPPEVAAHVAALGGPVEAFFHLWPEARHGAHVIRASSSDGIEAPGLPVQDSAGLHGFFLVEDVSQSKAILEIIESRAWTEGLAWITLGKSGAMLRRSIVDTAVGSPERLIFEAPPILHAPVTRRPRPPIVFEGPALAAPALPYDLLARAENTEATARQIIAPASQKQERAFIEDRAKDEAVKTGKSLDEARANITRMLRGGTLADDHLLQMKSGTWIRVGDILDDFDRFDRVSLPDPVEGIDYGTDKATLLLKPRKSHPNEPPRLMSHAHGARITYTFARYEGPQTPPEPPFYPAPTGDREGHIKAHGRVVVRWEAANIKATQASKAVKRLYGEIDELAPDKAALQRQARRKVQAEMRLDYEPTTNPRREPEQHRVLLSGALGVGKSAAIVGRKDKVTGAIEHGLLHRTSGLVSLLLAPDHAKAAELTEDYGSHRTPDAPPVFQLAGREKKHPETGARLCENAQAANKLAKKGANVKGTLCNICPYHSQCSATGYLSREKELAQIIEDGNGAVIIGPQEYAFLPLPGNVTPDLVVIDEALRGLGLVKTSLTIEDLGTALQAETWNPQKSRIQQVEDTADALAANLQFINPARIALRDGILADPSDPYAVFRARGLSLDTIAGAMKALHLFQEREVESAVKATIEQWGIAKSEGQKVKALDVILSEVIDSAEDKRVVAFRVMLEAVEKDLRKDVKEAIGLSFNQAGKVTIHGLVKPHFSESTPLLHLDGTADADLCRMIYGKFSHHHHPVEQNAHITQVTGHSFSIQGITGKQKNDKPHHPEKAADVRKGIIEAVARQGGRTLTVASAKVEECLQQEGITGAKAHYKALRGRNEWQDCDTAFIAGAEIPPTQAVEAIARAYASNDPEAMTFTSLGGAMWQKESRTLRTSDGPTVGVDVACHPDPWAERVLRQLRDTEIMQAIARLRLIYNKEPKQVVIMAPVVLDLTINEVVDWQDFKKGGTRLHQAIARGVLPLTPAEAIRLHPDLWKAQDTARRELQGMTEMERSLTTQTVNNIYLFTRCALKNARLIEYQCAPIAGRNRMRKHRALVWADTPDSARAQLEAMAGPLKLFAEVEGWQAAIEAAQDAVEAREERAAIAEYEQGLTRLDAERVASGLPPLAHFDQPPAPAEPAWLDVETKPAQAQPPPLRIATG